MAEKEQERIELELGGRKIKTTLEALREAARLVTNRMRDIVSVERKRSAQTGTTYVVRWEWASATESGHPDNHDRGVSSTDPWHPDFREAWEALEDHLKSKWGVAEVELVRLVWSGGACKAKVGVTGLKGVVGVASFEVKLESQPSMSKLVLAVEHEAFAYADRTKRAQMELGV